MQNRLPTKAISRTPYEKWQGEVPDLSHIKIFGSEAYAWIPKGQRQKLDEKAEELIFVGYAEGSKAYRLLDTDRQNPYRDVHVVETRHSDAEKITDTESEDDEDELKDFSNEEIPEQGPEPATQASSSDEPKTHKEAMERPDAKKWKSAMDEEIIATRTAHHQLMEMVLHHFTCGICWEILQNVCI